MEQPPQAIRDSWMKPIALVLAIMLWFIIKLSAELRYSNSEPVQNPTPSQPIQPRANPDLNANATASTPSPQPDEQEP